MTRRGWHGGVEARNILVIKLGALGDIVQGEGALHDIREHHAGARITILTSPRYEALFRRCPWVDDILFDPRGPRHRVDLLLTLRRQLREAGFDLVYDLQNNRRTGMYYYWLSVPWAGRIAGAPFPKGPFRSAVEHLAAQLAAAGVPSRHVLRPDVSWMADDIAPILAARGVRPGFVLLFPGSSARHPQKRWPHYAQLAQKLVANGARLVTAPGPDEMDLCLSLPAVALLDGSKPLSIFQVVGLVQKAAFVIGNDTGPTHIAAHAGAKGLALFGPHASAARSFIDQRFSVLEVADLPGLSVEAVYSAYWHARVMQPAT